jgi:hypothetical protein
MKEKEILQKKLESKLQKKAGDIGAAIEKITATGQMIDDYVVDVNSLHFTNNEEKVVIVYPDHRGETQVNTIHDFAYNQFGQKFGVPADYLRTMARGEPWMRDVAVYTLNEHAANSSRDRFLLRTVAGQTRAALSDKYRRLNSMQIFLAFLTAAQQSGGTLMDAHDAETRAWMEVIHPEVVEFDTPLNGKNYAVFGARIRNSDFGHGSLELRSFMLNVRCLNGLVGETMMREIHMGGAIPENIIVSEETMIKDTEVRALMVRDAMKSIYSPRNKEAMISLIKGASSQEINITLETEKLPKLGVFKGEVEQLKTLLMNNKPSDGLKGAPTMWKFINGLTAVARDSEPERKRELENIAGTLLNSHSSQPCNIQHFLM